MRLVKQVQLLFQEDTSDKVYEVDLCEGGEGEFVVNFRYGRRGARLQDGTKTPFPESREKADLIFDRLVNSKLSKGYRDASKAAPPPEPVAATPPPLPKSDPRRDRVRAHLRAAAAGQTPRNWALSRIIWRAGELTLGDSVQDLIQLSGKGEMSDYSLAWTLARCANPAAVGKLRELHASKSEKVRRIAGEGLARCLQGSEREDFLNQVRQQQPTEIQAALETNDGAEIGGALQNSLQTGPPPHEPLYQLYLVGSADPAAREAVYETIKTIPFKAPWFRALRHIFKASELRLDAEIYGLMAYRFERSQAGFNKSWGYVWDEETRKNVNVSDAVSKPDSKWGYSSTTRAYFRRRIIKTLRRAGEISDPASFIPLATGVLIAFDDDVDSIGAQSENRYGWDHQTRRSTQTTWHFEDRASALGFNFLLFDNSARYDLITGASHWHCVPPYQPGKPAPQDREEAFPHLWDQAPDAIEHLLRISRCGQVHEFAVKVWRANPAFKKSVTIDFIIALVGQRYAVTQRLGLDLAREAWDPANPDKTLILALATCPLSEAQDLALEWIRSTSHLLTGDPDFLTSLLFIPHPHVHMGVRDQLSGMLLSQTQIETILPRVVAALISLSAEAEFSAQIARQVRETLLIIASGKLGEIGFDVIRDLVAHPIDQV
ncbi:MAG: putative DNA-binding WGR domain protein, partial [Verrucomicrobiales bacterium]